MVDMSSVEDFLYSAWIYMAMTNYPYEANFLEPMPANPVKVVTNYNYIHLIYVYYKKFHLT